MSTFVVDEMATDSEVAARYCGGALQGVLRRAGVAVPSDLPEGWIDVSRWARSAGFDTRCAMSSDLLKGTLCAVGSGLPRMEDVAGFAMGILCKGVLVARNCGLPARFVFKQQGGLDLSVVVRESEGMLGGEMLLVEQSI